MVQTEENWKTTQRTQRQKEMCVTIKSCCNNWTRICSKRKRIIDQQ